MNLPYGVCEAFSIESIVSDEELDEKDVFCGILVSSY